MKTNLKITNYLVAVLLLFTVSCSEGFLNQVNPNSIGSESFWQDADDAKLAVNGMFHPIANTFFWGRIVHTGAILRSDEFNIRPFDTNTAMSTFQGGPGTARWALEPYQELYKVILRANLILENVNETNVSNQTERDGFLGQAYFCRGFAYWYLAALYGNTPLVLESAPDDLFPAASTQSELWAQSIADFTEAANRLPSSWSSGDLGRPTKGSATAFRGKTHLYLKNWADAETDFKAVTTMGYSLLPAAQYGDNFGINNENNVESVFEIQYKGDPENWVWGVDVSGSGTLANYVIDYSPPEHSLDQGHYMNPWVKDLFEANGDVVRRNESIAYDYPGATGYGGVPFLTDFAGEISVAGAEGVEPIFTKKYSGMDNGVRADVPASGIDTGNNWRLIRYSDVLLMLAEAQNEQGKTGEAEGNINLVRTRAGISTYSGLSQDQMRTAIIEERTLELVGESHRFFDLVRWGLADDYLGATSLHGTHPKSLSNGGVFVSGKHELVWIPQPEIDANSNLQQNPGY